MLLFVIWPFGSLLYSFFKETNSKSSYLIYYLFFILFAYHMDLISKSDSSDFLVLSTYFLNHSFSWSEINNYLTLILIAPTGLDRYSYVNILSFITHSFSNNPHVFFAVAAVPCAYFFLKTMRFFTSDSFFNPKRFTPLFLLLCAFFIQSIAPVGIGNPRWITAAWISCYFLFTLYLGNYVKFKKKWYHIAYFVPLLFTPFIHPSFWFFIAVSVIIYFIPKSIHFGLILSFVSIALSFVIYNALIPIFTTGGFLDASTYEWSSVYAAEGNDNWFSYENTRGAYNLTGKFEMLQHYFFCIVPYLIYRFKRKNILNDKNIKSFFLFYLYYTCFVGLFWEVPSLGKRFFLIQIVMSCYLWLKMVYPKHQRWTYVFVFANIMQIYIQIFNNHATMVPISLYFEPLPMLILDFYGSTSIGV